MASTISSVPDQNELLMNLSKRLADELRQDPRVVCIMLTGSVAKRRADISSDIDMMVRYSELPSPEELEAFGEEAKQSGGNIYGLDPEEGITLYRFVDGVKVDHGHHRLSEMEERLNAFMAEPSTTDKTSHIIFSGVQCGIPMHGHEHVESWQARLNSLPDEFFETLVRENLAHPPHAVLREMGLARGDYAFVSEVIQETAFRMLNVLCGLNRTIPPGKLKGVHEEVSRLDRVPEEAGPRFQSLFTLPPEQACDALFSLFQEIQAQVEREMPQIDMESVQARLEIPLRRPAGGS